MIGHDAATRSLIARQTRPHSSWSESRPDPSPAEPSPTFQSPLLASRVLPSRAEWWQLVRCQSRRTPRRTVQQPARLAIVQPVQAALRWRSATEASRHATGERMRQRGLPQSTDEAGPSMRVRTVPRWADERTTSPPAHARGAEVKGPQPPTHRLAGMTEFLRPESTSPRRSAGCASWPNRQGKRRAAQRARS